MNWEVVCKKILGHFDVLRKMLKDRAICSDNHMVIFDPPFTVKILRHEGIIVFQLGDKDVAILSKNGLIAEDGEMEKFVEEWCTALSSLGFRRYLVKKK